MSTRNPKETVESPASSSSRRRDFLRAAAALAVTPWLANLSGCRAVGPVSPAKSGAPPARSFIAIDMHNHIYPAGTEPRRGGPPARSGESEGPELSLADELARSGFTAVCASFVLDFAHNKNPGDARANLLRWFDAVDAELAKGHLRRALRMKDLEAARDDARPTLIQSVEGAHFIEGDLGRIEEVYGRGLRHLQLLHEKDDLVSPLGDTNTGVAHLGGLTAFGVEVVKQCNRLGIVVDLAHASHDTVLGALKVATQPLIVSHTNLATWTGKNPRLAEMMRPRLLSREYAQVIAGAGGLIGVWTHLAESLPEFVESVKAMVDAVGVDHVGIGTDTDLLSARVGQGTNRAWPGLGSGFFPAVADELRRQGFSGEEIAKIGGSNYCRVFAQVTAASA